MAFIKLGNTVINTAYIAAVELESRTHSGEISVSILIAAPKFPLTQKEDIFQSLHHYEWLEFTGRQAQALRDYFGSLNHVVDLLPESHHSIGCCSSYVHRGV